MLAFRGALQKTENSARQAGCTDRGGLNLPEPILAVLRGGDWYAIERHRRHARRPVELRQRAPAHLFVIDVTK